MPNRIIKESICSSENVDQLTAFQETFFYRLIVNCDDYGRMDARPKILASKLFPLKDLRTAQVEDALRALTSAELVILYEVDGKPFLQMKTWDRHQQVRAKKSKYPSPEDGVCNQLISDDSKCPRNPIQSESNPNPNPNPKAASLTANFEKFWSAYPRHENRKKAEDAFRKINPDDSLLEKMLNSIDKQRDSPQWKENGGQFIPHPTTWLNGKRWEDEVRTEQKTISNVKQMPTVPAQNYEQRKYDEEPETLEDIMRRVGAL